MLSRNLFLRLLCFTCILAPHVMATEVTYDNLRHFFNYTYDANHDGYATPEEFLKYFQVMEPEHNLTSTDILPIFHFFDSNSDEKVTMKELVEVAKIKLHFKTGHKQIHIGLTNNEAEMQIMWVSTPEFYNKPVVYYGRLPALMQNYVNATYTTYNVGNVGFHGRIYRAVIKNLTPLKRYYYKVGDLETNTFAKVKYFTSPPLKVQQKDEINIAVFGDMGTFAPFGHFVSDKIAKDHFIQPFDFVFLTGDIAYAGMNSYQAGQFEPIWDLFGELTQKFAAYTPFMPGVGNHEKYYNYTSYMKRYVLPRSFPEQTNLFFSFDYGQIHVIHFSSEHPYQLGSQQYDFLEADLIRARQNPTTKWIMLGVHRAFYSSDADQYSNITSLTFHLQKLVNQYKVDVVQTGHLHDYERTYPTYNGNPVMKGVNHTHYVDPQAPVYVVQGTAGALIRERFIKPKPSWSAVRMERYGYGRMIIKGNHLKYQYITIPAGRVADQWNIIKTGKANQEQTNQESTEHEVVMDLQ